MALLYQVISGPSHQFHKPSTLQPRNTHCCRCKGHCRCQALAASQATFDTANAGQLVWLKRGKEALWLSG